MRVSVNHMASQSQRLESIERRRFSLVSKNDNHCEQAVHIGFMLYVVALAAKLLQANNKPAEQVSHELALFRDIFAIEQDDIEHIAHFYHRAQKDKTDIAILAKQTLHLSGNNPVIGEELLMHLILLIDAAGGINTQAYESLRKLGIALGFNNACLRKLWGAYLIPQSSDPYQILEASRLVTYAELKKCFRQKVKDCHPDMLASKPKDFVASELGVLLRRQYEVFLGAYEAIKRDRKF